MRLLYSALALIASCGLAHAQGAGMALDAAQGNWATLHHTTDGGVGTDVCLAASVDAQVGLRVDENDIEVRFSDPKWSLPSDTKGDVTISAGSYSHLFHTASLNPTMLVGELTSDEAKSLLTALETAPAAKITFGAKTSKTISLSGSTKVLSDFQGCARQAGLADLGSPAGPANSPF